MSYSSCDFLSFTGHSAILTLSSENCKKTLFNWALNRFYVSMYMYLSISHHLKSIYLYLYIYVHIFVCIYNFYITYI